MHRLFYPEGERPLLISWTVTVEGRENYGRLASVGLAQALPNNTAKAIVL